MLGVGLGLELGLGLSPVLPNTIELSGFERTAMLWSEDPSWKELDYVRGTMAVM